MLFSQRLPLTMPDAPRDSAALRVAPPASTSDPERRALLRVAAGELDALGGLYDEHHEGVRAFAVRLVGDASVAEDLVHDVFLALPSAAGRFRGDSSLRTFLIAMAANLSRNHVRAAARRRALAARAAVEPVEQPTRPDEAWERRQLAARLQRALDELSLDHRIAFTLCEIEERSSPEVARMLGVPEATVRTRLFHAKRRLRELLGGER